jgi:hypothetical protein
MGLNHAEIAKLAAVAVTVRSNATLAPVASLWAPIKFAIIQLVEFPLLLIPTQLSIPPVRQRKQLKWSIMDLLAFLTLSPQLEAF